MNEAKLLPIVKVALDRYKINYKVLECTPELADTAAFCEHYDVSLDQAANTILVASRKIEPTRYAVCVVLATHRLDVNKKLSELLGAKKVSFADAETTERLTGMIIGGVTAAGIKDMPIYIDSSVMNQTEIVMGGGNRSSKLLISSSELSKLPNAQLINGLAKPKE